MLHPSVPPPLLVLVPCLGWFPLITVPSDRFCPLFPHVTPHWFPLRRLLKAYGADGRVLVLNAAAPHKQFAWLPHAVCSDASVSCLCFVLFAMQSALGARLVKLGHKPTSLDLLGVAFARKCSVRFWDGLPTFVGLACWTDH